MVIQLCVDYYFYFLLCNEFLNFANITNLVFTAQINVAQNTFSHYSFSVKLFSQVLCHINMSTCIHMICLISALLSCL